MNCVHTPWGMADSIKTYSNGVILYGTPSHGGFYVPENLLDEMEPQFQNEGGWYEEDCEYCKVILAFPAMFTDQEVINAGETYNRSFNEDGEYKWSKN